MTPEFAYLLKVNVPLYSFTPSTGCSSIRHVLQATSCDIAGVLWLGSVLSFAEHPRLGKATRAYSRCDLYVFRYVA